MFVFLIRRISSVYIEFYLDLGLMVSSDIKFESRYFFSVEPTPTPGGCAQNTMRILQWLCGGPNEPHVAVFYGGLGKDPRGSHLEKLVRADGLDVQ